MGQENISKWGCLSAAIYLNHSNRNLFCFTRRLIGCAVIKLFFSGISRQVCLFLKRGATQNDEDEDGQDPLSIAVQQANADIVTLYVYSLKTSSVKTFLCSFNAFLTSVLSCFPSGCVWRGWTRRCGSRRDRLDNQVNTRPAAPLSSSIRDAFRSLSVSI